MTAVDRAVLGRHHAEGWGTVLSTIPTTATTILGLLIGRLLQRESPEKVKVAVIAAVGLSCVILGTLLDPISSRREPSHTIVGTTPSHVKSD